MKIFDVDGAFYRFMTRLWSMVKLNILWIVFSIPIVTVGPATVAAFTIIMKMIDDEEGYIARDFVKYFKANFKNGFPLGILALVLLESLNIDLQLFNNYRVAGEGGETKFLVIGIVAIFVFSFCMIFAFPLSARYENTFFKTILNAKTIAERNLGKTIMLTVGVVLEVIAFLFNMTTIFIAILIGPVCIMYTIGGTAKGIFKKLEEDPTTVSNPKSKTDSWGDDSDYIEAKKEREKKERERQNKGIWNKANSNKNK